MEEIIKLNNEERRYNTKITQKTNNTMNVLEIIYKEKQEKSKVNGQTINTKIVEEYMKIGRSNLAFATIKILFCTIRRNINASKAKLANH